MQVPYLSYRKMHEDVRSKIVQAFSEFFDDAWYVSGPRVEAFEKKFAAYTGVQCAAGLSNGLDALRLALQSLHIGKGDEVIVPSNTYIATVLAVSYAGATPVFVEPDSSTYNIDPDKISEAITKNTKAIVPVHLYGQACSMESICAAAEKNNLYVIEDNAQAHGATFHNKMTGSFGIINATSFYPGKNLGALGEAGAVTTDNKELCETVKILRNYGSAKKYYNDVQGYNMRMDECQASFVSIKLDHLENWTAERRKIAREYDESLHKTGDLILPYTAEGATHVYHVYMIRTKYRDALQKYLEENGVGTMIHYPVPVHLQKAYHDLNFKTGDFPIAEEIAETCLSLPMWPGLSAEEMQYVCNTIKKFFAAIVNR